MGHIARFQIRGVARFTAPVAVAGGVNDSGPAVNSAARWADDQTTAAGVGHLSASRKSPERPVSEDTDGAPLCSGVRSCPVQVLKRIWRDSDVSDDILYLQNWSDRQF